MEHISLLIALGAGLASFFSPCVLPLLPAYISFITGLSIDELKQSAGTPTRVRTVMLRICAFIVGFSIIFIVLGASATYLGVLVFKARAIIRIVGGIVIILFGLHIGGIITVRFLQYEKRMHLDSKKIPTGLAGPFLVGMAFAIGWTPCVGPILGTILTMAATKASLGYGVLLLTLYSLGLGIPFLIAGMSIDWLLSHFTSVTKHLMLIARMSAVLLIVIGILMITNKLF